MSNVSNTKIMSIIVGVQVSAALLILAINQLIPFANAATVAGL